MTQRARQLGMNELNLSQIRTGWPALAIVMSTRDLAIFRRPDDEDFPEFYPLFAETEYKFDMGGRPTEHYATATHLLGLNIGADGLKTGHTSEAGYGLGRFGTPTR